MRDDKRRQFIPIIDSLLGSPKTQPRDRSNRGLDCRATPASKLPLNSAEELTSSMALRKVRQSSLRPTPKRRLLNTALTPMSVRQVAVPIRTPLRPCHRHSRRSRADLEAEAREAKGAFNRVLPVNPRIPPSSAIKVNLTINSTAN